MARSKRSKKYIYNSATKLARKRLAALPGLLKMTFLLGPSNIWSYKPGKDIERYATHAWGKRLLCARALYLSLLVLFLVLYCLFTAKWELFSFTFFAQIFRERLQICDDWARQREGGLGRRSRLPVDIGGPAAFSPNLSFFISSNFYGALQIGNRKCTWKINRWKAFLFFAQV